MPGSFKTEAVVLRSIRYGEADRILHLYTPALGRIGAIAKGVRRPRSRFGGRMEPLFRIDLVLHRGRGELATVTAAATVSGHPGVRADPGALDAGVQACEGVLRLLDSSDANRPAYNLLCRYLSLLDDPASRPRAASHEARVAFRAKLALAAGFAPELTSCAACGGKEHLTGFSGRAGGVVCPSCEVGSLPFSEAAHRFLVEAVGRPLAEVPEAEARAVRQADRAIVDTLDHHAHVHLRGLAA